jgi:predicted lipoprotein with Yx(FWY)xxD motif
VESSSIVPQGVACFVRSWDCGENEKSVTGLRPTVLAAFVVVLALPGCGGEDGPEQRQGDEAAVAATETTAAEPSKSAEEESAAAGGTSRNPPAAALARRPPGEEGLRVPARQARIVAKESAFGRVLFDMNGQVVYVFENDRRNRSRCTSAECVKAWPPVLTRKQPSAGAGVDERLLGTSRRSDGMLQVTYDGRPLYFYEHEAPGEIKCHNVDLHGGLWWVVTPRGDPAD